MSKSILVLVDSIDQDKSSGARANKALIENLAYLGYALTVCHYSRKAIDIDGAIMLNIREQKSNWRYLLSRSIRLFRRYTHIDFSQFFERRIGFSFTFLNDAYSFVQMLKSLDLKPFDLVITLSQGESFLTHYATLKFPECHSQWLAYIHDPYPVKYYPTEYAFDGPGTAQKIKFMTSVIKSARQIGFPSLLLKDWMIQYYPLIEKKAVIIPHQISAKAKMIKSDKIDLPEFFDTSKFNLLHAGNLLGQRSPRALILAYNDFLDKNTEAIERSNLIFIGHISETLKPELKNFLPHHNLFFSKKSLPFDLVSLMQKLAAVNIIIEGQGEISPFLPGKFPHCIMANKPILVLSPKQSETRRLLGHSYPYWAERDNVEQISLIIDDAYNKWLLNLDDELNRDDLIHYMGPDQLKQTLEQLI